MKQATLILICTVFSLKAHTQDYRQSEQGGFSDQSGQSQDNYEQQEGYPNQQSYPNQQDHQQQPSYRQSQSQPPHYNHNQPRQRQGWSWPNQKPYYNQNYRTAYNYFKASLGLAKIEDFSDSSGSLVFEASSIMPINLAYGLSSGHIAFEGELGFSAFDYNFEPVLGSEDVSFDGDLFASKLMVNGMFKTSQTSSNIYVGGGLGLLSVTTDGLEDDLSGSSLAAQLIVGAELRVNERSGLFVEYKHLTSFGLELENDFSELDFDYEEASLNLGFKFYF